MSTPIHYDLFVSTATGTALDKLAAGFASSVIDPPVGELWREEGRTLLRIGCVRGSTAWLILEGKGWTWNRDRGLWTHEGRSVPPVPFTRRKTS